VSNLKESFYEAVVDNTEDRVCSSIPDEECNYVAKNFSLNTANGTLTKLAEKIISPSLTLPWIMSFIGAPAIIIGALVPIKDAGSLLPQLFISGQIRSRPIRKWYWVFAAVVQGLCMAAAGAFLYFLESKALPWLIVALMLIFSMLSGVASVAYKDVSAKTVPKGQRGQMLSFRSSFGGLLALVVGAVLVFYLHENASRSAYALLFAITAVLWWLAAFLFAQIKEKSGATKGGRNAVAEFKSGIVLIKKDNGFRNFLMARALLLAVPLIEPFYVMLFNSNYSPNWSLVGALIIISGLAQVLSSPFWGKLADQSPQKLIRIAALISICAALFAIYLSFVGSTTYGEYMFMAVFFVNGIAYSGARLGRKTYLVDYAPKDERPTYVAIANTFIGVATLLAAGLGVVAQLFGPIAQIVLFVMMLLGSILLSFKLKSV
jgi:MFS family permease